MNKFNELSRTGVMIVVVLFVIIISFWYENQTQNPVQILDLDGDGKISKTELKYYLLQLEENKKKKAITRSDIFQNVFSGLVRGVLMGLILDDMEGGFTLAIMLGLINPILTVVETWLK